MASQKTAFLGVLPAVLLLLLARSHASLVNATAAQKADSPAVPLEHLDAFAEQLLDNNDFADEEALAETQSVRDLVPFIRSAFSAQDPNAGGALLPKEEATELLEVLQDIESLQDSQSALDENPIADKDVAQNEAVAAAKNTKVITTVLTRLASLATVKNMVSRKASAVLDLLMSFNENAAKVVNIAKRVAATLRELAKLQKRLMELADKFIKLVLDAINIIKEQWEGVSQRRQMSQVLNFFNFLLEWAGAAKEASLKKWQLIKALYAVEDSKAATDYQSQQEEVTIPGRLRTTEAVTGREPVDGHTIFASFSKNVLSSSLDVLFVEAEQARRVEREIAQSVWHQAAKCAREGLLPLPFVRILLGES